MIGKTLDPAANMAMYGGAGAALTIWGLQLSDIAAITSAFVALCGLVLHVWATVRREQRDKERHKLIMESMRNGVKAVEDSRER